MPNEVVTSYPANKNLYFIILDEVQRVWNGAWVTINLDNWNTYTYPMMESQLPGAYYGDFPSGPGRGIYYIHAYERMGVLPQPTDPRARAGAIEWNGYSEGGSGGGSQFEVKVGTDKGPNVSTGIKVSSPTVSITTGVSKR
jgi:hypothetical protein